MRRWFERAEKPDTIEYVFACNNDDPTAHELVADVANDRKHGRRVEVVIGDYAGSAAAWDDAAKRSEGDVLVQGQDDIEPPVNWSGLLWFTFWNRNLDPTKDPFFVAVSDGYRKDALCCTAVMSRARYMQEGFFICPEYLSVWSDDEVTYRAMRDARDSKCTMIDARNLVFLHRHPYHDKVTPWDSTYAKENSSPAYLRGEQLFYRRNPFARTDRIVTWH